MSERREDTGLDRALDEMYGKLETPESFSASWREAVRREERMRDMESRETARQRKGKPRFWRAALPAFAALVLVAGTILTGATQGDVSPVATSEPQSRTTTESSMGAYYKSADMDALEESYSMDNAAPAPMAGADADAGAVSGEGAQDARKIIRTADITFYTLDFDKSESELRALVSGTDGYIEYVSSTGDDSKSQTRRASFTLRIPTQRLDEFLESLSGIGRVTRRSESASDMTSQYADKELRLKTQRDKMERLQQLIAKAETVGELIEIEAAIADTQYMIDMYEGSMRDIDRRVDNSTVNVTLIEETRRQSAATVEKSLGQRLSDGLSASMAATGRFFQNMLVFITMSLPAIVIIAAIAAIAALVIKRRRRKKEDEHK